MRLAGKTAVVTGAAGGLGAATAERFASEGAKVVAIDLQAELLAKRHDGDPNVLTAAFDITAPAAPAAIVELAVKSFGRLDILINNAGIEGARAELADQTDAVWRRVFEVNVDAMFRLSREAAPHLAKSGAGRIVNTSSLIGLMAVKGAPAYAASKAAVIGLTRALAVDLGPQKITANCVMPGMVLTPINDNKSRERLDQVLGRIPVGRYGEPEDIASATLFLASDEAGYVTGQTLFIDGGWTINL